MTWNTGRSFGMASRFFGPGFQFGERLVLLTSTSASNTEHFSLSTGVAITLTVKREQKGWWAEQTSNTAHTNGLRMVCENSQLRETLHTQAEFQGRVRETLLRYLRASCLKASLTW